MLGPRGRLSLWDALRRQVLVKNSKHKITDLNDRFPSGLIPWPSPRRGVEYRP